MLYWGPPTKILFYQILSLIWEKKSHFELNSSFCHQRTLAFIDIYVVDFRWWTWLQKSSQWHSSQNNSQPILIAQLQLHNCPVTAYRTYKTILSRLSRSALYFITSIACSKQVGLVVTVTVMINSQGLTTFFESFSTSNKTAFEPFWNYT